MKKRINLLATLLFIFSISACNSNGSVEKTNENNISDNSNSSEGSNNEIPSEDNSSTGNEPNNNNTNEDKNNDSDDKKDEPTFVDMQLSNNNGLLVKFDKGGAKISSIRLNNLKIAEDGFIAGRVANRIANGTFQLDGKTYNVTKNNGNHCLHGGYSNFGKENSWTKKSQTADEIVFEYTYRDGDKGFPGNLKVTTTYSLNDDGELSIEYRANSDKKTLFNPTNHLYMNMNGVDTNTWQNHKLWVDSNTYTKANNDLIPTGEIVSVTGTKLDYFTKKSYVGDNDSNLVLNGEGYRKVAELSGDTSKISVEVSTDMPGLQVYNNNNRICLETQNYPDAIHHDNFPSIVLDANVDYYSKTTYKFYKNN